MKEFWIKSIENEDFMREFWMMSTKNEDFLKEFWIKSTNGEDLMKEFEINSTKNEDFMKEFWMKSTKDKSKVFKWLLGRLYRMLFTVKLTLNLQTSQKKVHTQRFLLGTIFILRKGPFI